MMKPFQTGLGFLGLLSFLMVVGCGSEDRNIALGKMSQAIDQAQANNFGSAVRLLEEAVAIDPELGAGYYYLGMIKLKQYQSPETAIPELRRAAELLPEHAGTHYMLGTAYADQGDDAEAMAALRRAVEIRPSHYRAWFRLGMLLEQSGQIMEAIDAYTESIRANPMFPNGYNRLGNIYARYEHLDEAIQVFEEGFSHAADPTNVNALGSALLHAGRVPEAIQALERAIQLDPTSVEYHYNLAVAYAEAYELSMSDPDKERALAALRGALGNCGALASQARCNALENYITEIENPEGIVEQPIQN